MKFIDIDTYSVGEETCRYDINFAVWVNNQGKVLIEMMRYKYVEVSKVRFSLKLKKRLPNFLSHKKKACRILC